MWNVMYDGVLRLQLSAGCDVVGFGYDVALVEVKREEVERSGNEAIKILERWLRDAGLSVTPHKTEAVLVSTLKVF